MVGGPDLLASPFSFHVVLPLYPVSGGRILVLIAELAPLLGGQSASLATNLDSPNNRTPTIWGSLGSIFRGEMKR